MQNLCIFNQNSSQKCIFEFVMRPWDANIETYSHSYIFHGTPSKLLVTRKQQDHGVRGLKAKICSTSPALQLAHLNPPTSNL